MPEMKSKYLKGTDQSKQSAACVASHKSVDSGMNKVGDMVRGL